MTAARHSVRNLRLSDETTQSLEASWELDDPNVASYRVLYAGLSEDDTGESVSLSLPPTHFVSHACKTRSVLCYRGHRDTLTHGRRVVCGKILVILRR